MAAPKIVKTPTQRLVSIAIDADGNITHAWQQTLFVVTEDGVEISRGTSPQENLEPEAIGKAVPQAGLLKQFVELTAASETAAKDAAARLADLQASAETALADTIAKLQTDADKKLTDVSAAAAAALSDASTAASATQTDLQVRLNAVTAELAAANTQLAAANAQREAARAALG